MKYKIFFMLCFFTPISLADDTPIRGDWEAYSRGSQAIFGNVVINTNTISWGVSKKEDSSNTLPCTAEYEYSFEKNSGLHIFKFKNKMCDYENMANSHISKRISEWKIEVLRETSRRLEAKFYVYDESGKSGGNGVFYKYFSR